MDDGLVVDEASIGVLMAAPDRGTVEQKDVECDEVSVETIEEEEPGRNTYDRLIDGHLPMLGNELSELKKGDDDADDVA